MSIYPGGKYPSLSYKFEFAKLDLPIPSDLGRDDAREWESYVDCLSPAQRIRKFGEALDEFHGLLKTAGPNLMKLPEDEQAVIYSKWLAATILNVSLAKNTQFMTEQTYRDPNFIKSDIDMGLFCLTDLMKNLKSPDLKIWEDRRATHNAISDGKILPLLNKFSGYEGKTPKKGGKAPTP